MIPVEHIEEILTERWFDSEYEKSANAITALDQISNLFSYSLPDWSEIYRLVDISSCIYSPALKGYRFCDLRLRESLSPDDLFLIAKTRAAYYDEMNHRVESCRSMSYSYSQLSSQVREDIRGLFTTGTMSYRNWWDYSETEHNHDLIYNSIASVEIPNDYLVGNNTVSVMATISIGLSTEGIDPYTPTDLCCPADQYIPVQEPAIGSIRLCNSIGVHKTDKTWLNSPEFDGWVPADGSTISQSDDIFEFADRFAKAIQVFTGNPNSSSFTIPKLDGHYKWTDYYRATTFNEPTPSQVALVRHTHFLSTDTMKLNNADVTLGIDDLDLYHSQRDLFSVPIMHAGRATQNPAEISLPTNLVMIRNHIVIDDKTGTSSLEEYGDDPKTAVATLEHDVIPALVYIGGHMQNYLRHDKYHSYKYRRA